jgi:CheY-like chemotaxis protein
VSCKNVLIVDDDQAIRQIMQDVLEVQGYEISTAADGREGIARLRDLSPQPCVVLLDMMMPGMNGWQFLDYQRNDPLFSRIPVIICSAYREIAKSVKASAILEKPIQLNALLDTVKAFCA